MEFKFDHIGIAVFSIDDATREYQTMGYEVGGAKLVEVFKAKAAYAHKEGSPVIELLEPTDDNSPVAKMLKQRGAGPYHTCFGVEDIAEAIKYMREQSYMPLGRPVPGPGLGNALTVFMYKKSVGLIQLVETK